MEHHRKRVTPDKFFRAILQYPFVLRENWGTIRSCPRFAPGTPLSSLAFEKKHLLTDKTLRKFSTNEGFCLNLQS